MTEAEYIAETNLAKLKIACDVLGELIAGNQEDEKLLEAIAEPMDRLADKFMAAAKTER